MIGPKRLLAFWLFLGLPGFGAFLGGFQDAAFSADLPAPEAAVTDDVQDIVFLGQKRPILLRLHIRIDGRSFRAVYDAAFKAYVQALFHHLDRKGAGFLDEKEAQRIPPPQMVLPGTAYAGPATPVHVAFNFSVVDADGNGKVTVGELAEYYRYFGAGPFQAVFAGGRGARTPGVDDVLFARLDTNKDGRLSREELAAAPSLLALDQDGDELLSPEELAPKLFPGLIAGRTSRSVAAPRALPELSPFVILSSSDARRRLAENIRTRYGSNVAPANPDVELIVRLGITAPEEPLLHILQFQATPDFSVLKLPNGSILLRLENTHLELQGNRARPFLAPEQRQMLLSQFKAADAKHQGYLTNNEALQSNFFPGLFSLLDRDGDGKLSEQEFLDYLTQVQEAQAGTVTTVTSLFISDEGRGLFDWLDKNRDGRLGLRELREAPALLDRMNQPALTRETVPRTFQLSFGLGQASFLHNGFFGESYSPPGMPLLALEWSGGGPLWFRKMDRNRDGDVSRKEFLGTSADFKRLDANADGLISAEEAERAADMFRK